ncbi:MAG: putative baseplate assembly protein, partial [Nitrospira sp.]|nr:putative baseplate assembly protein [Nitrospira sp.]
LKPDQDKGSDALRWEYETANGWEPLQVVQDETRGFRQSGSLEYLAPTDWAPANHFGIKDSSGKKDWRGYWLRIQWLRWDENAFPVVKGIVCNAVGVIQVKVKQNEILGSGTGEAFQMVSLPHHPVQPDPEIVIKEMTKPNPEQIRWFKETIGQEPEKDPQSGKVEELWVPWIPVNNFLFSGRDDRHFILDATKGTVTFGDGKRGRIPPAGSGNIKARSYRLTKGRQGNVGKGEIDTLRISKPGVDSVRNPEPVTGGVDIETIEEAKHRGPWMLKHRDRAVTIEDYEELAGRASREVGIAKASMQGQTMQVLIIPSSDDPKPQPSRTLLGTVQEFLDKRRVLTAALQVVGPMYTEVHFDMKLALKSEAKAQEGTIRQTILTGIQKMLHPLYGGDQGKGWPMGRALHVSEIYYLIEQIAEVDFVTQLWVWTGNLKTRGDRVQIPANGFPALGSLTVEIVKG